MNLPLQSSCHAKESLARGRRNIVLVGNPNTGKTTLFNRLTGLRAKTANFPGTTLESRIGTLRLGHAQIQIQDLPGLYGLNADHDEERLARDAILGKRDAQPKAAAAIVVVDATNLARNLFLAGQVRELGIPLIVVLNMIDIAQRDGLSIDTDALSKELACPVIPISARTGEGIPQLLIRVEELLKSENPELAPIPEKLAACAHCAGCRKHSSRFDWAENVAGQVAKGSTRLSSKRTEQIDRILTHPVLGVAIFAVIMTALFVAVFTLAAYPMEWIENGFSLLSDKVSHILPDGDFKSFIVDGVIGGVGGVLVFLPQICILFGFLSLLEDTGYLARAAFVMDRMMRKVGLPGKAFVPMLSAHACAIPAIMAARVIDNKRDRLLTILILPLLTCSARLPVYAMITALLFSGKPLFSAMLVTGAYALGIVMALLMALLFKRTLLPGDTQQLLIELPTYKIPSLQTALLTVLDRALIFLKRAGTIILLISIGLWALVTYPKMPEGHLAAVAPQQTLEQIQRLEAQAASANSIGEAEATEQFNSQIAAITGSYELQYTLAGRLGSLVEPIFRPLGFDWRINVGVISSFAARETFVSTLAIVYGVDSENSDDSLRETLANQQRPDGKPLFNTPLCVSLLVFYVLAMQCLTTQVVARRETGGWKWPLFQLAYMTLLAYSVALVAYQSLTWIGVN